MDCSPPGSSVMEFSRQEYWNGLSFSPPGDPLDPGIKPTSSASSASPALAGQFFTTTLPGKSQKPTACGIPRQFIQVLTRPDPA